MKSVPILVLALLVGLVGGTASGLLGSTEVPPPVDPGSQDAILRRLDAVSMRLTQVENRIGQLELEGPATPLAEASPLPTGPGTPAEDEAPVTTAAEEPVREGDLRETILDVVEERERTARQARERRRAESDARRTTALLDRLERESGLDSFRRAKLAELLAARRETVETLRERMRRGGETMTEQVRDALREEIRQARDESDRQIEELLTPEQFEAYQRQSRGGGRGPGRNADRGPGARR